MSTGKEFCSSFESDNDLICSQIFVTQTRVHVLMFLCLKGLNWCHDVKTRRCFVSLSLLSFVDHLKKCQTSSRKIHSVWFSGRQHETSCEPEEAALFSTSFNIEHWIELIKITCWISISLISTQELHLLRSNVPFVSIFYHSTENGMDVEW